MRIQLLEECSACEGDGVNWNLDKEKGRCPRCAGTGELLSELGHEVIRILKKEEVRIMLGLPLLKEETDD